MRSWTAGTARATVETACRETGALDERGTVQDLLNRDGHRRVGMAIQTI
jgi:hypothetical protein